MPALHAAMPFVVIGALTMGCGSQVPPQSEGVGSPNPGSFRRAGIEGEYVWVGFELRGEPSTPNDFKDRPEKRLISITRDTIEMAVSTKREKLKYRIDASKTPAEIDILLESKGDEATVSYGIYKLEGDTLTFFLIGSLEAGKRPREFRTIKPNFDKLNADAVPGGKMLIVAKRR